MLFNSYIFIFIFLPITLIGFHLIGSQGHHRVAISWLVGASLFFYGWYNIAYLTLIIGSILFNYAVGISLMDKHNKWVLFFGIATNILLLIYFKYTNFFVDNINIFIDNDIILDQIILPLAISFFTFQQITYLVDAYRGDLRVYNFLHYCLFVTFFPQLIAGPIVHHKQMIPQFSNNMLYQLRSKNLVIGLTIFILGLFKKVILADGISQYATPVFVGADSGIPPSFFDAWGGSLSYFFQLYFDFSGYSDMAIGIARMFGIKLPINFYSPYKANNMVDFWRRWHITLSNVIRDYLYYPITLSLTRFAVLKRYSPFSLFIVATIFPTIFTFFVVGLWHGAGWNFILFGIIHGVYIVIYAIWVKVKNSFSFVKIIKSRRISNFIARIITYLAVIISFVFFRAESLDGAINVLSGMAGLNGFVIFEHYFNYFNYFYGFGNYLSVIGMEFSEPLYFKGAQQVLELLVLLIVVLFLPNTQQFMCNYYPALIIYDEAILHPRYKWMEWRANLFFAFFISIMIFTMIYNAGAPSEFLYFQF